MLCVVPGDQRYIEGQPSSAWEAGGRSERQTHVAVPVPSTYQPILVSSNTNDAGIDVGP